MIHIVILLTGNVARIKILDNLNQVHVFLLQIFRRFTTLLTILTILLSNQSNLELLSWDLMVNPHNLN